jgi:hypothetical protein
MAAIATLKGNLDWAKEVAHARKCIFLRVEDGFDHLG